LYENQKPTFHVVEHIGYRMGDGENDERRRNFILYN
jgi:hypothetical protein